MIDHVAIFYLFFFFKYSPHQGRFESWCGAFETFPCFGCFFFFSIFFGGLDGLFVGFIGSPAVRALLFILPPTATQTGRLLTGRLSDLNQKWHPAYFFLLYISIFFVFFLFFFAIKDRGLRTETAEAGPLC